MTLRRITLATTLIPFLSMSAVAAEPSWSVLIVIRGVGGDFTNDMPYQPTTEPSHFDVTAGGAKSAPNVTLDVTKGDLPHVDRVIGVQTITSVHSATPIVVKFGSEALCKTASDLMSKKADVVSATCFQTN